MRKSFCWSADIQSILHVYINQPYLINWLISGGHSVDWGCQMLSEQFIDWCRQILLFVRVVSKSYLTRLCARFCCWATQTDNTAVIIIVDGFLLLSCWRGRGIDVRLKESACGRHHFWKRTSQFVQSDDWGKILSVVFSERRILLVGALYQLTIPFWPTTALFFCSRNCCYDLHLERY